MIDWKRSLLALAATTASASLATPAEDFARGSSVELVSSAAHVHVTDGILYNSHSDVMNSARAYLTKGAGSSDLDIDFTELGVPAVVHFTGTVVGPDTIRFTANQEINQCLPLDGANRKVKHVTGTLLARLQGFVDPVAGDSAPDFAHSLLISSDPANQLHFTVNTDCNDISLGGDVLVGDLLIEGLAGRQAPELPAVVSSLSVERTFICPSPAEDLRVAGSLRLRNRAPRAGVPFTLTTTDARVITPTSLPLAGGVLARRFTATVPAGYLGDVTLSAHAPGINFTGRTLTVSNGLAVFGGKCRYPKFLAVRDSLRECLACDFRGRLRNLRPAATVARSAKGIGFMSAASTAGSAGYSTLEGKLAGLIADENVAALKQVPDVEFYDMSDFGLAIGTFVNPQTSARSPASWSAGQLKLLPSPSGFGEARVVNNQDAVGGFVLDTQNSQRAALWRSGTLQVLHPQGALQSEVVSLSEDGLAVVSAISANGQPQSFTFDLQTQSLKAWPTPAGYDGVEVIGATREGLVAGNLITKGVRAPFIDFGAGVQLLSKLDNQGFVVDRLISLDADGALLASITIKGVTKIQLLEVQ